MSINGLGAADTTSCRSNRHGSSRFGVTSVCVFDQTEKGRVILNGSVLYLRKNGARLYASEEAKHSTSRLAPRRWKRGQPEATNLAIFI